MKYLTAGAAALTLCACGGQSADDSEPDNSTVEDVAIIGENLAPFGEGYPNAGDPCLRLGESEATSNYLDDSAILVGCPTEASAEALGGEIVGNVDGVRLVSVSMGDANEGMGENGPMVEEMPDVTVAGTDYNATAPIPCTIAGTAGTCDAGVKRNWGEDGTNLIEVTKPDGRKRAIFLEGTTPIGADSAQADGSAAWDFKVTRDGDRVTVDFGPERYVWVDAFVEGG